MPQSALSKLWDSTTQTITAMKSEVLALSDEQIFQEIFVIKGFSVPVTNSTREILLKIILFHRINPVPMEID